jgi:hypothetical protein
MYSTVLTLRVSDHKEYVIAACKTRPSTQPVFTEVSSAAPAQPIRVRVLPNPPPSEKLDLRPQLAPLDSTSPVRGGARAPSPPLLRLARSESRPFTSIANRSEGLNSSCWAVPFRAWPPGPSLASLSASPRYALITLVQSIEPRRKGQSLRYGFKM